MLFKITISVILVLLFSDTEPGSKGAKSGRAGNKAYQTEEYDVAAGHYQAGITDAAPEGPSAISHGLFNNLGSALYRQGKFEDAQIAFDQAMLASASNEDMARAAYNAGNNAFRRQDMETALTYYRDALLTDPENAEAKFNYEFVKRMMQNNQQQQGGENQEDQQENNEQQESDQNNQNQEEQDQQNQQQPQEEEEQGEGDQQREQQQQPDPNELSREQAERILEALQTDEKDLLKDVMKMNVRPRRVDKDW